MRLIWALLASLTFLSTKAQTHLPIGNYQYTPWLAAPEYGLLADSSLSHNKWHLSKYAGISAGMIFSRGGTTFLEAPVGLQLSHSLTNNLVAFAGISAAPVLFSVNRLLTDPASHSYYPGNTFSNAYRFGINPKVEMGLMYINDAKTFSISGSIGVERSSYPFYPSANRVNTQIQ